MRHFFAVLLFSLVAPLHAAEAPFAWKLDTAKATHHFIGSVHLLPQQAQPLPPALERALDASAVLVFESDIARLSDADAQAEMLSSARSSRGIQSEIDPALYRRLQQRLRDMSLSDVLCDAFRAWFCSMKLEIMHFMQQGFRPELGIDQQLFDRAAQQGKAVRWFEPLEKHLGLFTGMTPHMSVEFLASTLDEMDAGQASPQQLLQLWQDNDLSAVEKMLRQMKAEHPLVYERLLAGRNRNWLPQLRTLLQGDQPVLVVVGAAHYAGPEGLLALLKARGFALQPVSE